MKHKQLMEVLFSKYFLKLESWVHFLGSELKLNYQLH